MAAPYFDLIREMKNPYNHRLRLVESARQRGIKPTARLFQTTVATARKWLGRYQQQGPSGLLGQSRAPRRQPRKTPPEIEQAVVGLRRRLFTFGARRLIREFHLPLSHRTLERIWREHGLIRKRRRKYQRKQDLARERPAQLEGFGSAPPALSAPSACPERSRGVSSAICFSFS